MMKRSVFLILTAGLFIVSLSPGEISSGASNNFKVAIDSEAPPSVMRELTQEFLARGESYVPRTEHLQHDGLPVYINRLIREDSPYLLQHAHNPVNWYSWGKEAFELARQLDKPVFLSIGYATCHWCHVMERESFENEGIAQVLNRDFVAIKVDREQRPDVDATFMQAAILLNGHGGWPLSGFLSPEGKPFYAGAYFPPDRFIGLLKQIVALWNEERVALNAQSDALSEAVKKSVQVNIEASEVGESEIARAVALALQRYDDFQGGFGQAPKFPQESLLYLLLENARRHRHAESLQAATFSLQQMSRGGIHDQLAGGFHRYSVDNGWLVPHFEKMLYNQAALARNYLSAYQLTGDEEHARTARRTLDYVLREMTVPGGAFYSATDADSEGGEGVFFLWTINEIDALLDENDATLAKSVWSLSNQGNFEGANILHLPVSIVELAERQQQDPVVVQREVDRISKVLLSARNKREAPIRDEKILTEWNGMMISALASGAVVLDEPDYAQAARRVANWLWSVSRRDDGLLWRTHFEGSSSIKASQLDYVNFAEGLLALYDLDGDSQWLKRARAVVDTMNAQFWDPANGAYFMGGATAGGAQLVIRPKDLYDGATPSGNAVAMRILARLWRRTGEEHYRQLASELLKSLSGSITRQPDAFSYLLVGAGELLSGESGAVQYAARGRVQVRVVAVSKNSLEVRVSVAPGWHINADEPLQDYLIGTKIEGIGHNFIDGVAFPKPTLRKLEFQRDTLALLENDFNIAVTLLAGVPTSLPLRMQLQACNDKTCLAPEALDLSISLAGLT